MKRILLVAGISFNVVSFAAHVHHGHLDALVLLGIVAHQVPQPHLPNITAHTHHHAQKLARYETLKRSQPQQRRIFARKSH